jgi:hypothetical protein
MYVFWAQHDINVLGDIARCRNSGALDRTIMPVKSGFSKLVPDRPPQVGKLPEFVLQVQFLIMKKWIGIAAVAIAGLVYIHRYESARIEARPEKIRSSPAEINTQHELELRSETPLQ